MKVDSDGWAERVAPFSAEFVILGLTLAIGYSDMAQPSAPTAPCGSIPTDPDRRSVDMTGSRFPQSHSRSLRAVTAPWPHSTPCADPSCRCRFVGSVLGGAKVRRPARMAREAALSSLADGKGAELR